MNRTDATIAVAVLVGGGIEAMLRWPTMYQLASPAVLASSWFTHSLAPISDAPYVLGLCLVVAALAGSIATARTRSGWALVALWVIVGAHVMFATNVLATEVTAGYAVFWIARSGPRSTSRLAGISAAVAAAVMTTLVQPNAWLAVLPIQAERAISSISALVVLLPALGTLVIAGVPWSIGVSLRSRAEQSATVEELAETRSELAHVSENARLRSEQARLARDVHDVVGHSLTVILAQAQAGQYAPDLPDDAATIFRRISDTARTSLRDVRAVLASTSDSNESVVGRIGDLDDLIESVSAAGHHLDVSTRGSARTLSDEVAAVAYRTLQEMLTNALRHGRQGSTVSVRQDWSQDLRLEVRNTLPESASDLVGGTGITAMKERLASVGGSLRVERAENEFVAAALIPLPGRTPSG